MPVTSTVTSTQMVNQFFQSTGQFFTQVLPLLYLFLGLFIFIFAFSLVGKAIIKNVKRVGR